MSDDIDEISLDDDMAKILADINAGDEGSDDANITAEVDDDARDERGRFKAKAAPEEAPAESDADDAGRSEDAGSDAVAVPVDTGTDEGKTELARPPSTWRAPAKAIWGQLPAEARAEILKREQDIGNGIGQYKQAAEYGHAMRSVVDPYLPMIQSSGSTPEAAVQSLLATAYKLRTGTPQERGQMLLQVAQQYGADLSGLQQQPLPPEAQQLQAFLSPLQQKMQQIEGALTAQQRLAERQTVTEATTKIAAFQNQLDETGQPKHLYFDDVREDMANLIDIAESQGRTLSLDDAYDAAVWARPDLRQLLLAAQQRAAQAKQDTEAKQRAAAAQRTARTNVRSAGAPRTATTAPAGSIEDTMRATMRDIKARTD